MEALLLHMQRLRPRTLLESAHRRWACIIPSSDYRVCREYSGYRGYK
jgi:hypothetical protein